MNLYNWNKMDLSYLVNNKKTIVSITKKIQKINKEHNNSFNFLSLMSTTFIYFSIMMNLIALLICLLGVSITMPIELYLFTLSITLINISIFSKIKIKLKNKSPVFKLFKGLFSACISFNEDELINKTISNLNEKEILFFTEIYENYSSITEFGFYVESTINDFLDKNDNINKFKKEDLIAIGKLIQNKSSRLELLEKLEDKYEKENSTINIKNIIIKEI